MLSKKNLRIFFLITFVFFININLFAAKAKIQKCSPNSFPQGQSDLTLNIVTNQAMPQKTKNENLYSEVLFSSPYIRVKKVEFKNNRVINCTIDVDRYADVDKKIDLSVISYDEAGNETIFEGRNMISITRQSFIDRIVVHSFDGRIKIGEPVSLTIRGANFEKGKVKVLLRWSGLDPVKADSPNGRNLKFDLSAEETSKLKVGTYSLAVYNKDGSVVRSETQVEVVE